MANRRGSTMSADVKAKGEPYQVYSEVVNTGKTLEQTKRKIRWVIGFTDMNDEIEIILKHSLVTGKKSILENGREIVSASNFLATDFSHGWTSPTCGHFFRIEASITLSQDNYVFSVDGIQFYNMQKKPSGVGAAYRPKSTNLSSSNVAAQNNDGASGRYAGDISTYSASAAQRYSATATVVAGNNRASFQSPIDKKQNGNKHMDDTFDPFAPSSTCSTSTFDPFGGSAEDPFEKAPVKKIIDPFGPTADPFGANNDPFGNSNTASQQSVVTPKSVTHTLFGSVESATAPSSFDPFSSSAVISITHDPFAPSPAPSSDPFGSNSSHISSQSFDPFAAPATATTSRPAQTLHSQQHQPDIFSFDAPVPTSSSKPNRRASAIEIAQDFADLSFASPAPVASVQTLAIQEPVVQPTVMPDKEASPVDPWQTGLVDLDLSGKSSNNRRQSLNANSGPTLDSLMSSTPSAQRRSSMTAGASINVGQQMGMPVASPPQTELLNPFGDAFAPPQPPRPVSSGYSAPLSSFTLPSTAGVPPMAPHNTRASFIMANSGVQPINPMGLQTSFTPAPGVSNISAYSNSATANSQVGAKSSLDSLDWKSFQ